MDIEQQINIFYNNAIEGRLLVQVFLSKSTQNIFETEVKNDLTAQIYFEQAEKLRFNYKFKESVDKYLRSILINRNSPLAYIGLAISYKNLKKYDKAISTLEKAQKLNPFDFFVQKELALCYISQKNYEKGIKHLIISIKLEPNNIDLQMQLALVHELIEEDDIALMIYQKIIETNPEYIRAYIQKATLYMHLEDYLPSAKIFKKVISIMPDYFRAYLALGICFEKLGNTTAAKRYYLKFLKFDEAVQINKNEVTNRLIELRKRKIKNYNLKLIKTN